jgi:hypothetical protein
VKNKDVRTNVFDWKVPIDVDGRAGAINGTLFWTPVPSSDLPLPFVFALAALVIVLCIAIVIKRRRTAAPASPSEAW